MTATEQRPTWDEWLASLPEEVLALAREFPITTAFDTPNGRRWIVGYTNDDELLLTRVDPWKDYDAAVADRLAVPAQMMRDAIAEARRDAH